MFLPKISNLIRSAKIDCSVVVVAAGSSDRFGADKMLAPLLGTPVIAYSLAVFQCCGYVKEIVVVVPDGKLETIAQLCDEQGFTKVSKIVLGGATRVESALSGASECRADAGLIAIHDGARPLVSLNVINRAIECAQVYRAAVPAIASRDTVKIAPKGVVSSTPDRREAFSAQTPQVFDPVIIKGALTNALSHDLTVFDDASAVEALGFPVYISEGSEENIKITTPLDLKLAETILTQRKIAARVNRGEGQ